METNLNKQQQWKTKKFKSYYVVWKPYEVTTANNGLYRLNRTMQYGNFSF